MIRLVVIGAGIICQEHLKTINTINKFKIVGIHSRTSRKAYFLAKKFRIKKVYKSIDNMISQEKPDAIAVFVSAENMYKVLRKVIKYKTTFFFEKPAALNYRQTKNLQLMANKFKVKNMVGLNRRFYSVFKKGKDFLKKHGGAKAFLIEGHERFWKISNKINKQVYKNWIYANGIHTIDLIRFFGGEYKELKSFCNNQGIYKNITISLKFKNKLIGTYISNWGSPGGWSVSLFGNRHTIIYKPLENGIIVDRKFNTKKIQVNKKDIKFKTGFYEQMKCFEKLVSTGKLVKPAQGLNDLIQTINLIKKI